MKMRNLDEIMSSLEGRFAARRNAARAEKANAEQHKASRSQADDGQLPLWAEARGDNPEAGVRSTLFNAQNRQRRSYLEGVPVIVKGVGRITYRGEELCGDDQAVWLQIMDRVRQQPRSDWVEFTPRSLLKAMGWGTSSHDHARLRDCLQRMQATALGVAHQDLVDGVSVSLIDKCEWLHPHAGKPGRWRVWIEPEMKALFAAAQGDPPEVPSQGLSPLARRLQNLYTGHAKPYPRKVETLWRQYGVGINTVQRFRAQLKAALDELKTSGFLDDYRIDDHGLVHVVRAQQSASVFSAEHP